MAKIADNIHWILTSTWPKDNLYFHQKASNEDFRECFQAKKIIVLRGSVKRKLDHRVYLGHKNYAWIWGCQEWLLGQIWVHTQLQPSSESGCVIKTGQWVSFSPVSLTDHAASVSPFLVSFLAHPTRPLWDTTVVKRSILSSGEISQIPLVFEARFGHWPFLVSFGDVSWPTLATFLTWTTMRLGL